MFGRFRTRARLQEARRQGAQASKHPERASIHLDFPIAPSNLSHVSRSHSLELEIDQMVAGGSLRMGIQARNKTERRDDLSKRG